MYLELLFAILAISGVFYIWIGNRASKGQKDGDDYYLMGRQLKFFPLMMTFVATQVGGGTLIGAADSAYSYGYWVLFYPLGVFLGLLVIGLGYGKLMRRLNLKTTAEIFNTVYGSVYQQRIASILSIISFFLILVAQAIAIKKLFVAMGADQPIFFFLFWSGFIIYTVLGGLKAVVDTDVIQSIFIIIILVVSYMFTISQDSAIDFMAVSDKLNQVDNIPWEKWLILPFCFMLIEQDMGQRCFASENDNALKYSGILSGFIMFACSLIAIYFGIKLIGVNVDIQSSILLESVKLNTNPLISTFFMAALLMAVISTADSLLCSISSNVFCDFFLADTDIRIAKIITFIIGILSFIAATYFNNVVNLLMLSYEISVYTLFVPTIFAILGYKSNKLVSGLTMVVGAVAYLFFTKNNVYLYEIWTIAISAIIFFVTSKLFRKSEL